MLKKLEMCCEGHYGHHMMHGMHKINKTLHEAREGVFKADIQHRQRNSLVPRGSHSDLTLHCQRFHPEFK